MIFKGLEKVSPFIEGFLGGMFTFYIFFFIVKYILNQFLHVLHFYTPPKTQ